ncbi:hypothetical protein [Roseobacter weihaiensis]|uniref:hypothetical protein n=1 Tax=Roseobacter weihaiensis TaxID=2763262 RepID=UPI001D09D256|nr:hypothetical protein [Roseobacter sp. H9]
MRFRRWARYGWLETGLMCHRPHRHENLCEVFWDLPDDPKAALRWSLSKLRRLVDTPQQFWIVANREHVAFGGGGGGVVDIPDARRQLRQGREDLPATRLENPPACLDTVPPDGLGETGGDAYQPWLIALREGARAAELKVL